MSIINKAAPVLPLLIAIIAPSLSWDTNFAIRSSVRISRQLVLGGSSLFQPEMLFTFTLKPRRARWQTCTCLIPQEITRSGGFLENRECFCGSTDNGPTWRRGGQSRSLRGGMMGGRWFGEDIINWFKKKWDECQSYFCQTWKD